MNHTFKQQIDAICANEKLLETISQQTFEGIDTDYITARLYHNLLFYLRYVKMDKASWRTMEMIFLRDRRNIARLIKKYDKWLE